MKNQMILGYLITALVAYGLGTISISHAQEGDAVSYKRELQAIDKKLDQILANQKEMDRKLTRLTVRI